MELSMISNFESLTIYSNLSLKTLHTLFQISQITTFSNKSKHVSNITTNFRFLQKDG